MLSVAAAVVRNAATLKDISDGVCVGPCGHALGCFDVAPMLVIEISLNNILGSVMFMITAVALPGGEPFGQSRWNRAFSLTARNWPTLTPQ